MAESPPSPLSSSSTSPFPPPPLLPTTPPTVLSQHQRRALARERLREARKAERATHHTAEDRRHAERMAAFDDRVNDDGPDSEFNQPLTVQQHHHLALHPTQAAEEGSEGRRGHRSRGEAPAPPSTRAPPPSPPPHRRFHSLSRTDPSTLTPLGAALLALTRKYAIPDRLALRPPTPPPVVEEAKEALPPPPDEAEAPPPAFRHRPAVKMAVRESVVTTHLTPYHSPPMNPADPPDDPPPPGRPPPPPHLHDGRRRGRPPHPRLV